MANRTGNPYKPLYVLFAILVGWAGINVASTLFQPREVIVWRTSFADATAEARRDGKPMLVYFTAAWCGPCQLMKREAWADDGVERQMRDYVPVKVDVDHDPDTASAFQINGMPTMVVLDASGKVFNRAEGYRTPAEMISMLAAKPTAAPAETPTASAAE